MEITKDTKIKYTFENKEGECLYITVTIEQIEGSVPNFYEQIQEALEISPEDYEIVKREIINI